MSLSIHTCIYIYIYIYVYMHMYSIYGDLLCSGDAGRESPISRSPAAMPRRTICTYNDGTYNDDNKCNHNGTHNVYVYI